MGVIVQHLIALHNIYDRIYAFSRTAGYMFVLVHVIYLLHIPSADKIFSLLMLSGFVVCVHDTHW